MNEMELLTKQDLLADLASSIEQYGAKTFSDEFKRFYPDHHKELLIQMQRKDQQIPALLKASGGG